MQCPDSNLRNFNKKFEMFLSFLIKKNNLTFFLCYSAIWIVKFKGSYNKGESKEVKTNKLPKIQEDRIRIKWN